MLTRRLHDGYMIAARVDEDEKQLKTVTRRLYAGYTTVIRRLYDGYTTVTRLQAPLLRAAAACQVQLKTAEAPGKGGKGKRGRRAGAKGVARPSTRGRRLERVLLVGAASRMPAVATTLQERIVMRARTAPSSLSAPCTSCRYATPHPNPPARGTRASPRHPRQPAPAHASSHHPRHVSHPLSCNRHVTVM